MIYPRNQTVCPAADGNLFVVASWSLQGGSASDAVLMKVNPAGGVLWSRRFRKNGYAAPLPMGITDLILDSEGMLIASGNYPSNSLGPPDNFILRYDPVQDTVLWAKFLTSQQVIYTNRLLEKQTGGNYLFYRTVLTLAFDHHETEMLELDRLTGAIIPDNSKIISWGNRIRLTKIIAHQGELYALGTQIELDVFRGPGTQLLCKMNLAGNEVLWANAGPELPEKVNTVDLLIDQDTLVSLCHSDSSNIYLQKTTLNGHPIWTRRYELSGLPGLQTYNVRATPSGYLIFGKVGKSGGLSGTDYLFVTTDKAGHLQHFRRLPTPPNFQLAGDNYIWADMEATPLVTIGESFYATGDFLSFSPYHTALILLKSDLALTDINNCPFAPLGSPIIETTLPNFTPTPVPLAFSNYISVLNAQPFKTPKMNGVLEETLCFHCDQPCGPPFSLGPDLEFFTDTTILLHAGANYSSYLWQDGTTDSTYLAAAGGTYWVEVKDDCDVVQRDTIHLKLSETVCVKKSLSCLRWELLDKKVTVSGHIRVRIRLTNNCASALQQIVFTLPNGVIAVQPANDSTYVSPSSSRTYTVRNPSFSPFYSIRFRANSDGLHSGFSDVFTYELPGQSVLGYLHTAVKLVDGSNYEAFLNTSACTAELVTTRIGAQRTLADGILSPNPTDGRLWLRLPDWKNQALQVRILNIQGQVLQTISLTNDEDESVILLSPQLANGLYYAVVKKENEVPLTWRFVLAR